MGEVRHARLERELIRLYASRREVAGGEAIDGLVSAMVAEDTEGRNVQSRRMGEIEFVAAQVRYIPAWTWALQVVLVALMCAVAHAAGDAGTAKAVVGVLSATTALVGVPAMQTSRLHLVAELEYACAHNTASVMVARLIVLGCSSALAVAFMVSVTAPVVDASVFDVALWACPPFFLSCAGSLMALRKAPPVTAGMLCVAWTTLCSIALLALASVLPDLYASTSLVAWASAATAALVWLMREVVLTLRVAAAGLDAFSPQLARTYN